MDASSKGWAWSSLLHTCARGLWVGLCSGGTHTSGFLCCNTRPGVSYSNSPSWPSQLRCRVSAEKHTLFLGLAHSVTSRRGCLLLHNKACRGSTVQYKNRKHQQRHAATHTKHFKHCSGPHWPFLFTCKRLFRPITLPPHQMLKQNTQPQQQACRTQPEQLAGGAHPLLRSRLLLPPFRGVHPLRLRLSLPFRGAPALRSRLFLPRFRGACSPLEVEALVLLLL